MKTTPVLIPPALAPVSLVPAEIVPATGTPILDEIGRPIEDERGLWILEG